MGQYTNSSNEAKDCFRLKLDREVKEVLYDKTQENPAVNGLKFTNNRVTHNQHQYDKSNYVICSGENVGALGKLELKEPAFAGFAGAS